MKAELRVTEDDGNSLTLSNKYIDLYVPKRSILLKGLKLKQGDVCEITLKKVNPKRKK